jgi:hypothetical protein
LRGRSAGSGTGDGRHGEQSRRAIREGDRWRSRTLTVLAEDFGAWLDQFADALRQGTFVYVEGFGLTDDPPDEL